MTARAIVEMHATNLLKVKASVIRTFVMERKCPDYGGSTVLVNSINIWRTSDKKSR